MNTRDGGIKVWTDRRGTEDEVRRMIRKLSSICASEEFMHLRQELEGLYTLTGAADPGRVAFEEALYAFLEPQDTGLH